MSWVAVTGLSLYILLFANDGPERRRGALILLALTVPMLWSRLFFQFFAQTSSRTRRNDGDVVAGYRADRKYGSFCR